MQKPVINFTDISSIQINTPSKTDSLIGHMQYQIDSLSKIVHDTQIGQGFFSDALSQNLYFYTTIVGVLGLASWGWLELGIRKEIRLLRDKVDSSIGAQNEHMEENLKTLKSDLADSIFHVRRAMYSITSNSKIYATAFTWSVSAVSSILNTSNNNKLKPLKIWLKNSIEILPKVTETNLPKLQGFYKELNNHLDLVLEYEFLDDEARDLTNKLLKDYLQKAFKGLEPEVEN